MFSIFKQASDNQEVVLQELSEDQLAEVAGGMHHHHHHHHHHRHHHHHPTWTGMKPPTTGMGTGTTTGTTTGTGTTTTSWGTYPARSHW